MSDLEKPTDEIPLATKLAIGMAAGHVNCTAFPLLGVKLVLSTHCTPYNNPYIISLLV